MFKELHRSVAGGLFAAAMLCVTAHVSASSIEYSAAGNYLLSSSFARLPVGDTVELGTFNFTSFDFASNKTNYAATNAAFTLYATTTIGTGIPTAGQFDTGTGNLDSSGVTGKQLYIWVFNTSNPATATQWAIITDTTDGDWVGPATGATGFTAIDTGEAGVMIPSGALGSRVSDSTNTAGFSIALGNVPEPSTYALIAIAGFAVFAGQIRKRRFTNALNRA